MENKENSVTEVNNDKSMRKFLIIWLGQFLSMVGSGISGFGLSLWVLEKNESVTSFTLSFLFLVLPGVILSPIAGSLADRKNRKMILIITDSLDAITKIAVIVIISMGKLSLPVVYSLNFLSAAFGTFQGPAFNASMPEIVPKDQLTRANGLLQLNGALRGLVIPIIATFLYGAIGLKGLFILDFFSFFFAIGTIMSQNIPQTYAEEKEDGGNTFFSDFKYSIRYVLGKKGFMTMLLLFSLLNGIANLSLSLLGPLVKAGNELADYGKVNSITGLAMVLGSLVSGLLPEINNKIRAISLIIAVVSIGLIVVGLFPGWMMISLGLAIFFLPVPYLNALLGSLIQRKVDSASLGRVTSLIQALITLVTPISIALAGPLSDKIFNPAMEKGGTMDGTFISRIIGVGPGRGIALLFIICGILLFLEAILMLSNKDLMNIDKNVPDVV